MTAAIQTNRRQALFDLVLIIGTLVGSKSLLLQFEDVWFVAGPISLILTLIVAMALVFRRGEGVADVGLRAPKSLRWLFLWTLIALVVTILVGGIAEGVAASVFGEADEATRAIDERYQGRFDNVPGNLNAYLFWIATAWIVGGFTEEILFRGVLILRFEQLFRKLPLAPMFAISCQAFIFGQQHAYYQGFVGWVATGAIAFVSGLFYLGFKRNLWPLILSHGLANTIGLTLIYLG